jgi:flagellar biosynthetic protein FliO
MIRTPRFQRPKSSARRSGLVGPMAIRTLTLSFFAIALMIVGLAAPLAADEDIGAFDINKVRQAAVQNAAALPGDTAAGTNHAIVKTAKENIGVVILRIAGCLILIIGMIFGVLWLIRRMGVTGASRPGGGAMDVVEVLPFGQGRSLTLVRVMDKVLVLGQTPQQIVLLDKLEGEKAVELIASTKGGTSILKFKDVFNSFFDKMKK